MDSTKAIDDLKIPLTFSDKFFLAFTPVLLLGAILFAFYITYERSGYNLDLFSFSKTSDFMTFILFSFLVLSNIYHLTLFKKYSKLIPVYSNLDIEAKAKIIEGLTNTFKWKSLDYENTAHFTFLYTKYLFGMSFLVTILIDNKGFYINVGHGDFKLLAFHFYKIFERKILKKLDRSLDNLNS